MAPTTGYGLPVVLPAVEVSELVCGRREVDGRLEHHLHMENREFPPVLQLPFHLHLPKFHWVASDKVYTLSTSVCSASISDLLMVIGKATVGATETSDARRKAGGKQEESDTSGSNIKGTTKDSGDLDWMEHTSTGSGNTCIA